MVYALPYQVRCSSKKATIRSHARHRADRGLDGSRISPYDELVKRYAERHGFDWPLIVALMYRESRFRPDVVSWAGARGLMQLLPVTAQRFGVSDLSDPESSIHAGIRMLKWLYGQMEEELPVKDRTWFALAAYNAGLGHLLDELRGPRLEIQAQQRLGVALANVRPPSLALEAVNRDAVEIVNLAAMRRAGIVLSARLLALESVVVVDEQEEAS